VQQSNRVIFGIPFVLRIYNAAFDKESSAQALFSRDYLVARLAFFEKMAHTMPPFVT
jgi:hypothetical protein